MGNPPGLSGNILFRCYTMQIVKGESTGFMESNRQNEKFRIEKDFLGAREVPADAYYGVHALRGRENFPVTGDKIHPGMIAAIGMVKKAAALANCEAGLLEPEIAAAMAAAAEEMIAGKFDGQFIVDPIQGGAGTSLNMNANEIIANRALELTGRSKGDYARISPNNHANMGQSTNDVCPTAIHIAVLRELTALLEEMTRLHQAFADCAVRFDKMIKMGRTHLQDAVPIRLGQEFGAYAQVVGRDIGRIGNSRNEMYPVNLGATAVGTGLNTAPGYIAASVKHLAELSGFPLTPAENLVDGTQNADGYATVSAALKICMLNMSKIANDLRLMASGPRCGLAELFLPPRQSGSSIMPGKVNPVMAEVVNQVAFQVAGNDTAIGMAAEAGQFELNVMEPVIVYNLLHSTGIMRNVFRVFRTHLLEGLQANEEGMRTRVENSVGIITAAVPHIGYEASAEIARQAVQTGRPVRELLSESGLLSEKELAAILDPREMTEPGIAGYGLLKKS